jgi:two-component system response regulator YesN
MLIRLEGTFTELDFYSLSLMEYAIGNLAEEIFEDSFKLWLCKDVHDYLVFLVVPQRSSPDWVAESDANNESLVSRLEHLASYLQLSIKRYLKGGVSILVSQWGSFPTDIHKHYQGMLSSLRKQVGTKNELFIPVTGELEQLSFRSLQVMYEPPLLIHLLESGQWDAIRDKLESLLDELQTKWASSHEHLVEVYFYIYSAYSFIAHKNGRSLIEMIGLDLANVNGLAPCRSLQTLWQWVFQVSQQLQHYMNVETQNESSRLVRSIEDFINKYIGTDVSLQAIADHLFLHPVYVSRVYKLETGENLSNYILRIKMEKAATLLTGTKLKTYEIALQLGYSNPKYFIKVFKKYYSLPPQEFRLNSSEG